MSEPRDEIDISLTVNGSGHSRTVPARLTLADFLRGTLGMTGTHVGCEQGVCGACTVLLDGVTARSCLHFAVQVSGAEITTMTTYYGVQPLTSPVLIFCILFPNSP